MSTERQRQLWREASARYAKKHKKPIVGRWPKRTVIERFWSHVDKTPGLGPHGDCWEWRGGLHRQGYGLFWNAIKEVTAHRFAWEITNGSHDLHVLHHCDNPPCVRPEHLFLGTNFDNMQDALRKGRLKPFNWAGRLMKGVPRVKKGEKRLKRN